MRKKAAFAMDSRYTMMIENAFYYTTPLEVAGREKAEPLPVIYQFIKRLIFKVD